MRNAFRVVTGLLLSVASAAFAESTWEFSVQASARVQASPSQIVLTWPQDSYMTPNSYTIYRKALSDTSWGTGTMLPGTATSFTDNNVVQGTGYEYQVVKITSQYTGYGYVYAGINLPLVDQRGRLLLVVENTYSGALSNELARLQSDLTGDGWTVTRLQVNRSDSPASVKNQIKTAYAADPANTKAVFLFGRVPVPYSGNIVPDGHVPDHQGAWPADGYYGDVDGAWTDSSVSSTGASAARNQNVPGDGKFDQSSFPSAVDLMVGRVDLANMPGRLTWGGPATFPSEQELLRNYLNKDHRFRQKQFDLPRRAYLGDFFGNRGGEAFVASGWRNFAGFFGASNLVNLPTQGNWITTLASNPSLAAYGCGAGSYTSIAGLGNSDAYNDVITTELYSADIKSVFTLFFGSWLGDWDSEDNILRCVLALPSYGLASAWSGRPHWFLHHMAMGETIGYGARLTQNNGPGGLYQNQLNSTAGQVHVALMGDPTLRLHMVAPPSSVVASAASSGVSLQWTASAEAVLGYHVYSAASANGPFTRLTTSPVAATSFDDASGSMSRTYMVRAVKLETSASGSYYNASQGAFANSGSTDIADGGNNGGSNGGSTGSGSATNTPSGSVTLPAGSTLWVDDSVPGGAVTAADGGDTWNWSSSNPAPAYGASSHQSSLGTGLHQHYFHSANSVLTVNTGDILFAYLYIDPANPPSEVMLQWNDGNSWEHRAFWGSDSISYGQSATSSRVSMGAVPAPGQWTLLNIPASAVALEGKTVTGMAFSLYGGNANWDAAGKTSGSTTTTNPPPSGGSVTNTPSTGGTTNSTSQAIVWIEDALPGGAQPGAEGGDSWNWISSNPAPFSGTQAHESTAEAAMHQHYFTGVTTPLFVSAGDVLYTYVYLDPANPPSTLMLQWYDGSWEHRAFWGADTIPYGNAGTPAHKSMGALPQFGQWARLEVPASQVALEGSSVTGMAFSLYSGRAVWDQTGKNSLLPGGTNTPPVTSTNHPPVTSTNNPPITSTNSPSTSTNPIPGVSVLDGLTPQMPDVGSNSLRVLAPTVLELVLVNSKQPDPAQVSTWNLVDSNFQFLSPPASAFQVTVNGQSVAVSAIGFRRMPLYAPLAGYDLRIGNYLYLQLATPVSDGQTVEVKNPDNTLWNAQVKFVATANPLRYSPAIHVNQEGYMPNYEKKAMVGYYLGSLGEMNIPASSGFRIVDANTGQQILQGSLVQRTDSGYQYTPAPYQKVYEADFSALKTPGEYRLVVPGLGASTAFLINDGVAMSFARAYALGLYHQRCGAALGLPHTRFHHDRCHVAQALVPVDAANFSFTWNTIAGYANILNDNNPTQVAPRLTNPSAQRFPFVSQGSVDVSGGHHDAGDYSKYTINSASLVHYLVFAADSLQGVSALDNLGIPESGDGVSDLLQEAKWEADFIAKLQDADGGFYFLVYPQNREYEGNVTPDKGDQQVVWPKTSATTAASVAALAQCASSPLFKQAYPEAATSYLAKAQKGWKFLTDAIAKHGKNGMYQKITHYGDDFVDDDELAWAACEMFLATGDPAIHQLLLTWFDPANPATWRWGWWHMAQAYGHAIRSYAFAPRNGRLASTSLNPTFLSKCQAQIAAAADDVLNFTKQNAYGTAFPPQTKAMKTAGWYFSTDQAFDLAVAYQLNAKAEYLNAMLLNMNYEGGCNPVNVTFVTGLGWKRQRETVSQWALNDKRVLSPSGIPLGNVQGGFGWLWNYGGQLQKLIYPNPDATTAPYPFYDRWADTWNVSAEMVVLNQARSLGTLGFLASLTALKTQPWKAVAAQIVVPTNTVKVGSNITVTMQAAGLDLDGARITWEARDQEPAYGSSFTFAPKNNGAQWVEGEAQLPDGRRVFAAATFNANAPDIVWSDDAPPTGATTSADGGDSWNWVTGNPAPYSGTSAHQSAAASGAHQHLFVNATATLQLATGDVLYAWVYLNPANPPKQVMLQWNNGNWEHRAYWGANLLGYGSDGTPSRRYMGPLPATGQWVQLKVPASTVGLEGSTVTGMAFTLYDGQATWDKAGRLGSETNSQPQSTAVTVSASTATASRLAGTPGEFTFTRTGDTTAALQVTYTLGGTAVSGTDYQTASGLTIPAGAASAKLQVVPLSTTNIVPTKSVVLNVQTNSSYGSAGSLRATVSVTGNTITNTLTMTPQGPSTTWKSTAGRQYRVAYKNNLSDSAWTLAGNLTASGATSTFVDRTATNRQSRFYVVGQVN